MHLDGDVLDLSAKEFALLRVLAGDPTRVFTKAELLRSIWGQRTVGTTRTLDSHACRLRRKLGARGDRYVVNVWGVGYRLVDAPAVEAPDALARRVRRGARARAARRRSRSLLGGIAASDVADREAALRAAPGPAGARRRRARRDRARRGDRGGASSRCAASRRGIAPRAAFAAAAQVDRRARRRRHRAGQRPRRRRCSRAASAERARSTARAPGRARRAHRRGRIGRPSSPPGTRADVLATAASRSGGADAARLALRGAHGRRGRAGRRGRRRGRRLPRVALALRVTLREALALAAAQAGARELQVLVPAPRPCACGPLEVRHPVETTGEGTQDPRCAADRRSDASEHDGSPPARSGRAPLARADARPRRRRPCCEPPAEDHRRQAAQGRDRSDADRDRQALRARQEQEHRSCSSATASRPSSSRSPTRRPRRSSRVVVPPKLMAFLKGDERRAASTASACVFSASASVTRSPRPSSRRRSAPPAARSRRAGTPCRAQPTATTTRAQRRRHRRRQRQALRRRRGRSEDRPLQARHRRRRRLRRLRGRVGAGPERCARCPTRASAPSRTRSTAATPSRDFDGDGLSLIEEYTLWLYTAQRQPAADLLRRRPGHEPRRRRPRRADGSPLDMDGNGYADRRREGRRRRRPGQLGRVARPPDRRTGGRARSRHEKPVLRRPENQAMTPLNTSTRTSTATASLDGADDQDHDGWTNIDERSRSTAGAAYPPLTRADRARPACSSRSTRTTRACRTSTRALHAAPAVRRESAWAPFDGSVDLQPTRRTRSDRRRRPGLVAPPRQRDSVEGAGGNPGAFFSRAGMEPAARARPRRQPRRGAARAAARRGARRREPAGRRRRPRPRERRSRARSSARPARSTRRRGRRSPSARRSRRSASARSSRCCAIRTSTRCSSAARAPIWIERGGRLERDRRSRSPTEAELREAIERLLARAGRRADEAEPICDARLPDGSRVNVVLPPLAVDGPALTIRRFRPRGLSAADLVGSGPGPQQLRELLARRGARAAQRPRLRRDRVRQDDDARRARRDDRRRRAHRDDRGHGRAAPRPPARRAPRGAAGERRGSRRGHDPRARAQRAAHAAGPDPRRRGPRAGGARHARRARDRARRLAVDGPRGLARPRRCAGSRRSR